MKIDGIIIEDKGKGIFFAFVRQFPGICAQGKTMEEANQKVNAYFKKFIETMKDQEVDLTDTRIVSM